MSGWADAAYLAAAVGGVASLVAVLVGIRALKDSHAARLGAARDRDRQRLELIAEHQDRMRDAAIADNGQFLSATTGGRASPCSTATSQPQV